MTSDEIHEAIAKYNFYHNIRLTDEITTPGNQSPVPAQEMVLRHLKTIDLKGKRALDIGCRDGLFCFAAESLGAAEVIGIDNDLSPAATEFLIPFFKSKVQMRQMNVYDLKPDSFGLFDVIIFPGVLYHLRYPFWSLRCIREALKEGGQLLIETGIWDRDPDRAMLFCPVGAESPYEPSSCTFFNPKGLTDTLLSMGFETTATERLYKHAARPNLITRFRRSLTRVRKRLMGVPEEKRANVNRFVSVSTYQGFREDSALGQYWEKTHDIHSLHTDGWDTSVGTIKEASDQPARGENPSE
jgi:SAM-dependent methyltransferase